METILGNFVINNVFRRRIRTTNALEKPKLSFYGYVCTLPYMLCRICYRKKYEKEYIIREVGERRVSRELDIVYFLRKQLLINIFIKATTTKAQRSLLKRNY